MKRMLACMTMVLVFCSAGAEEERVRRMYSADGEYLTDISGEMTVGDQYISADDRLYQIVRVDDDRAVAEDWGLVELPSTEWMEADEVQAVSAKRQRIALYCTHSDESFEPSDGVYSTTGRGAIYEVAAALADALSGRGIDAELADTLHHPHDAGAYRRSRQTAVQLLKSGLPDALIDIHRDGIPDPASYEVAIGGEPVSKIRLLVGRGNQNAESNKEFALMIKAVADRVYPGLIKDIYMGKGAFNQDLLPQSILLECGTYTLEKERVLASMPLMADVLDRALYGGVTGSAGRIVSDASHTSERTGGIVQGQPDAVTSENGTGSGFAYLGTLLLLGIAGLALLSAGSFKGGMKKTGRNLHEMTGGLLGRPPKQGEEHDHS